MTMTTLGTQSKEGIAERLTEAREDDFAARRAALRRAAQRRGDAHRDLHEVAREGLEGIYHEAGLELTEWLTDPDGLYALSLARRA